MRYNGIEYGLGDYKNLNDAMMKIVRDASAFFGIPSIRITHEHIENYCIKAYGYKYIYEELSDRAKAFLGKLMKRDGNTFILINDNKTIPSEKKNQAKMHETVHSFRHCKTFDTNQDFNKLLHSFDYSSAEKVIETEADLGGVILMLNDDALYNSLVNKRPYNFMKEFFKISDEHLKLRLKSFLVYNYKVSEMLAENAISRYKNSDIDGILRCVKLI